MISQDLIFDSHIYKYISMASHSDQSDIQFMKMAIELGKQVQGYTGDNPYVGAIVVKDGIVIGKGQTLAPGKGHAEALATQDAESNGFSVADSTVYSTVEPCSFFGRTPSCASMLVEKCVRRVVIGIRDPHPLVNGAGIQILRSSNIEVTEGICAAEVKEYLVPWLLR